LPPGEAAAWCVKGAPKTFAFSPLHSMARPDERRRVTAPHLGGRHTIGWLQPRLRHMGLQPPTPRVAASYA